MERKQFLTTGATAAGWVLLGVGLVYAFSFGFQAWGQMRNDLKQAQAKLERVQGWLEVKDRVTKRHNELLKDFARVSGTDLTWAGFQSLQQALTS